MHELAEALALLTEAVGYGDLHPVEEQLGGVLRVQPDLLAFAAPGEAGRALLHADQTDAALPRRRVGLGTKITSPAFCTFVMNVFWPLIT